MKVLLTGATGLLGSHLLKQLTSAGYQVSALVREIPQRSYLGAHREQLGSNLSLIHGDLLNCEIPGEFDVVIHGAAMTSADPSRKDEIWKVNLNGTQNLFDHLKNRYGKWVQISSVSTLSDGSQETVSEAHQGQCRPTPYAESKLAADRWLDSQSSDILTIHPCYMLGEWDSKPSSGAIFHAVKMGKLTSFPKAVKNFVSPKDVAEGILKAMDGKRRGHYLLGHENVVLSDFFELLKREINLPSTAEGAATSPEWMNEFAVTSAVSSDKARADFGYSPKVSLPQMLRETMDYFEKYKLLRRAKEPRPSV